MTKPQKVPQINWEAFDALLRTETPSLEWVSLKDLELRYERKLGGGRIFNKLKVTLDCKKFKGSDGKWRNYYRVKK